MKKVSVTLLVLVQGAFAQFPPVAPVTPAPAPATPVPGPVMEFRTPGSPLSAPLVAPKSSLSFDVRSTSSGGGSNVIGGVMNQTRIRQSETVLELKVRNFSPGPASARFEWLFLAKSVQAKRTFVSNRGEEMISVLGSAEVKKVLGSGTIAQSTNRQTSITAMTPSPAYPDARYKITSAESKQGARAVGWIVRMFIGNDVVAVRASSSEYEKIGRDPFLNGVSLAPAAPSTSNPPFGPGGIPLPR